MPRFRQHLGQQIGPGERNGESVAVLGPADFFGEMSFLTGEPRSATVVARRDVLLFEFGAEAMREVVRLRPALIEELSRVLGERKAVLEERIRTLPRRDRGELEEEAPGTFLRRIRAFFGL